MLLDDSDRSPAAGIARPFTFGTNPRRGADGDGSPAEVWIHASAIAAETPASRTRSARGDSGEGAAAQCSVGRWCQCDYPAAVTIAGLMEGRDEA